jgi:hypothetical protein
LAAIEKDFTETLAWCAVTFLQAVMTRDQFRKGS